MAKNKSVPPFAEGEVITTVIDTIRIDGILFPLDCKVSSILGKEALMKEQFSLAHTIHATIGSGSGVAAYINGEEVIEEPLSFGDFCAKLSIKGFSQVQKDVFPRFGAFVIQAEEEPKEKA